MMNVKSLTVAVTDIALMENVIVSGDTKENSVPMVSSVFNNASTNIAFA